MIQSLPPRDINNRLGWCIFPFVMLPTIAIFFVRFERIASAYPYLVAGSVLSVLLSICYKLIAFALGFHSVSQCFCHEFSWFKVH